MAIIVPNSASVYDAAASVPNSANRWAWLGLVPSVGGSASVIWFQGTAASAGSPMLPIVAAQGQPFMSDIPFNSPCGFFAASLTGGCAVIWLKAGS